ncbi:MAG: HAD-IA family hydrolase, partial [Chloroflexota bacterium]
SEAGIKLAFASTTSAENIQAIGAALGDASPYTHFAVMTHSDTVQNRKPAPDVYLHVLEQLNISADRAIAIEDTHESMMSAVNAGIACVATPGDYVRNQDFSEAVAIADPGQIADVEWLRSLIATPTPA